MYQCFGWKDKDRKTILVKIMWKIVCGSNFTFEEE